MSLHADVSVPARDRRRLARLCRYVARPPLASERLEEQLDGRLALRLKTRWRDGTTHILMERRELIDRLVPLIPPPRAHQVRYHGILAPSASQRDRIVPGAPTNAGGREPSSQGGERGASAACDIEQRAASFQQGGEQLHGARPEAPARPAAGAPEPEEGRRQVGPTRSAGRMRWAALLQRVFEVGALRCPRCGSAMRLIAAIEDPAVAECILECLKLPARAPPLARATAEPEEPERAEGDWSFDQTPAHEDV